MEQTQQIQKIEGQSPMGPQVEKHKYIFPNIMAKMMKNVSMQVQFESSLMATALILIGLILMAGFMAFFGEQTLSYKIILAINLIGGFIFMSSNLVTTYQQYQSYMDVMDFQTNMGMSTSQQKPIKKYNRKNQVLFYGGLIILICAFFIPGMIANKITSMSSYEYYILGIMILIGVLMIIAAVKKPKQKILIQQPIQNRAMAVPVSRPAITPQIQQPRPIQRTPPIALSSSKQTIGPQVQQQPRQVQNNPTARPVLKPTIRPQVQQKPAPQPVQRQQIAVQSPVQRQQIPAQRPIQAARPAIQAQQRPIQQVQPRQVFSPQAQPKIQKPGVFARLKEKLAKRKTIVNRAYGSQVKPVSKKEQEMMSKMEQSFNKQMYDIDHMKAQERRS